MLMLTCERSRRTGEVGGVCQAKQRVSLAIIGSLVVVVGEVWGANRLALLGMNTAGREINQERVFVFSSADLSRSAG